MPAKPCSVKSTTEDATELPPIPEGEQNIRLDDEDEEFALDAETIKHIGPIECKMLKGADNKFYLLEVARLTPLDANYVKASEGGAGNIADNTLETLDESMFITYTLRQELVHLYRIDYTKAAIMKAFSDAKGQDAKVPGAAETASDVIAAPTVHAEGDDVEGPASDGAVSAAAAPASPALELKKGAEEGSGSEAESAASAAASEAMSAVKINPNVFISLGGSKTEKSEDLLKDEEMTRNMSNFLWGKVVPTVTEDIRMMNQVIVDGEALTKYFHEYGINMRYLGRVAQVAREQEATDEDLKKEGKIRIHPMPKYWLEILEMEMIARAMKHIAIKCIREQPSSLSSMAGIVTDLLNFLLGSQSSIDAVLPSIENAAKVSQKKKKTKKVTSSAADANGEAARPVAAFTTATAPDTGSHAPFDRQTFWEVLSKRVETYFCGSLSLISQSTTAGAELTSLSPRVARLPLLRRVCQQLGITVAAADYDFTSLEPFSASDLVGISPKVKIPASDITPYVDDLRERAVRYAEQGQIGNASALFQQAVMLLEQVYLLSYIRLFFSTAFCNDFELVQRQPVQGDVRPE